CAVPAVAMSAAGIMTLSVFAIGWVVLDCGAAFQFTTAFPLKLLPVTVNMKSEPPCIWLAGMIAATTGTMPDCVICFGRLYPQPKARWLDRKSTRLNSSHGSISYAVFCLEKKNR